MEPQSFPRSQEIGRLKDKRKRITWKEYKRMLNEFEMEGFMAQKGLWNLAREDILQDRGALPKGEGDVNRKFQAVHDENFLNT